MDNSKGKFVPVENVIKMTPLEQYVFRVQDFTSRYNNTNSSYYAPSNLIGKYEKYPSYGDFPETYFLRSYGVWWKKSESYQKNYRPQEFDPLGAEDYITLEFQSPVIPRDICIYETYNPGAVVRIWGKILYKTRTQWILLWDGPSQLCIPKSRKFHPRIKQVNHLINTIRIDFNQSQLRYHYSVDAVLLGGYQPVSELHMNMMCKGIEIVKSMSCESTVSDIDYSMIDDNKDSFVNLPYEVMIHIFNYLDLKSLSNCARVNKRWNELADDAFLYQNLTLKNYWYLVNCDTINYFMQKSTTLKKLDLSWCGRDIRGFDRMVAMFIGANCDSLTHLSLGNCKFINKQILMELCCCRQLVDLRLNNINHCLNADMPSLEYLNKLVSLDLTSCDIDDHDLINILKANPNLKHIIIDLCENLYNLDQVVETIVEYNKQLRTWSSWKTLSLTAEGVRHFAKCPNIRELDLGWCLVNKDPGDCLTYIAEGCPELKRMILSEWRGLNDHLIIPMIMSCKELSQLDFLGIKNISGDICQKALLYLPKLRLLDISFCDSVRQDEVDIWRQQFPHITIQRSCECDEEIRHWIN